MLGTKEATLPMKMGHVEQVLLSRKKAMLSSKEVVLPTKEVVLSTKMVLIKELKLFRKKARQSIISLRRI